jgi:hypothetical protein
MNKNRFIPVITLLALTCGWCQPLMAAPSQILVNHLGYDARGSKRVVVQSAQEIDLGQFQVLDSEGRVAFEGPLQKVGKVDGWTGRFFHQGDLSTLVQPGAYARQYVKAVDGKRGAFFVSHRSNETDSWWQGENARLASLATAALLGRRVASPELSAELRTYS